MNAPLPGLDGVDHVHVYVSDRAASERWYAENLGLHRMPELAFWADGGPLTVANAEGTVHIALFERPKAGVNRATIAFRVGASAFLHWQRHLSAVLARPLEAEDHDVSWSIYFADPDGNPFEITSYEHALLAESLRPK